MVLSVDHRGVHGLFVDGFGRAGPKREATSFRVRQSLIDCSFMSIRIIQQMLHNLALNNATNVIEYYHAKGQDVQRGRFTYIVRACICCARTRSPVQDRIKQLKGMAFPSNVQFSACANTMENMEKKEGRSVAVLSDATIVPSGVVQLMEKQEKGWSYLRP